MIRLIAMDMDGTLLIHPSEGIAARNAETLRQAVARGVKLAICSGRTTEDASYFALDAGLDMAIMGLNGAYCLDRPLGQCVANHTGANGVGTGGGARSVSANDLRRFQRRGYCAELPAPGQ